MTESPGQRPADRAAVDAARCSSIADSSVQLPIRVRATPRWRATARKRPRESGDAVNTAARNRRRRRASHRRIASCREFEPVARCRHRRQIAGVDRSCTTPLASAICRTPSARPSLRSMHAVAARLRREDAGPDARLRIQISSAHDCELTDAGASCDSQALQSPAAAAPMRAGDVEVVPGPRAAAGQHAAGA